MSRLFIIGIWVVVSLTASAIERDIHPIAIDTTRTLEAEQAAKQVLYGIDFTQQQWRHEGLGRISYSANDLIMQVPVQTNKRAQGSPDDPDYATYGSCIATCCPAIHDWERYNRIVMDIYPACRGEGVVNMNLVIADKESSNVKAHLINLRKNQWNHVVYEIAGLSRKDVRELRLYTDVKGRNLFLGDSLTYRISNIRIEKIKNPDKEKGWEPESGRIVYSMSGYYCRSRKTAIAASGLISAKTFQLIDAHTNHTVFSNRIEKIHSSIGTFALIDFSSFDMAGDYKLQAGQIVTPVFHIGNHIFDHSRELVLNFLLCQRCGYAVPGIHGVCHADLFSVYKNKQHTYMGGWHDAGDLSQQTLQSADVVFALLEEYNKIKKIDTGQADRLKEEAEWGLDFILRNRLGDGYHASSMGLLHWTDGIAGTADDIRTVRVQNNSFDNFLYAGYEAYAALSIPEKKDTLTLIAKQDFAFARQRYDQKGFDKFQFIREHTYNTSPSQYMATMSWSASMLYKLTGKAEYAKLAAQYIRYVLDCQEKDGNRDELKGFFYRDATHQAIVHFIHQSRDQVYAQALVALCNTQPHHADFHDWHQAIVRYGNYLKSLMRYTLPYGMIPSGVYLSGEYRDAVGFHALHVFAPDNAKQLYEEQIRQGVALDSTHYVRRFPTWFSILNGNEAILLSTGKAAAVCGHFLNDDTLLQIGREQLYWTVGKNPFCQSLIFGEGYRYPSMDSFSIGEIMGEMPVGIRAMDHADIPYWPQTNNACYKEVWVTSAGKWLSLLAEYER